MSILDPSPREVAAVRDILAAASAYESFDETARKATKALLEAKRHPHGTCGEVLLKLCDAMSDLLDDIKAKEMLEQLSPAIRLRIDYALIEARAHLNADVPEQNKST
jgi:hypothetical protein